MSAVAQGDKRLPFTRTASLALGVAGKPRAFLELLAALLHAVLALREKPRDRRLPLDQLQILSRVVERNSNRRGVDQSHILPKATSDAPHGVVAHVVVAEGGARSEHGPVQRKGERARGHACRYALDEG
eukprot:CAMPEP_0119357290 /NCGR_PEP_ID=MMETSP1334-20130426/5693_1 /TAXON_ID=127549 /ORGANISM="Calcidiscus leptoporus, Strain RCC1130" /LENGTH=128 /DNA_ID=CAMNT_0007371497 /DNA_START=382 /DNA_END=764 /DNA_ORIENTATION=-